MKNQLVYVVTDAANRSPKSNKNSKEHVGENCRLQVKKQIVREINTPIQRRDLKSQGSKKFDVPKQLNKITKKSKDKKSSLNQNLIQIQNVDTCLPSSKVLITSKSLKKLDNSEYKKLHNKLNTIQEKISDMKKNLQKRKEQKQKIIEKQNLQRQEQILKRKQELKISLKTSKSHTKSVKKFTFDKQQNNQKKQNINNVDLGNFVTRVTQSRQLHTFDKNPYSPRHHNIYYVSELVRAYRDESSLAREHLRSSLQVLKIISKSNEPITLQVQKKQLNLFQKFKDRKTIIFDLDETLIHCNDNLNQSYDVKLPIKFPTGQIIEAGINIRPYALQIIRNLSKYFEIIIFTASHSCYANVVIDYIDPNKEYINHRLFREHCHITQDKMHVKDLRIINRNLKDVVLIDNAAYSYAYQLENGIPILPYYNGKNDFELKALQKYLNSLVVVKDVRKINKQTFKLQNYCYYYQEPEKLVQELYIN